MIVGISSGKNSWAEDRYPEGSHNLDNWTTEGTPLSILDIKGGETVTLYTMSANVSKVLITGYEKVIVTNPKGITCGGFESITSRYDSIYGNLGYGEEHVWNPGDGGCVEVDDNHIRFESTESEWGMGETDVTKMTATFKTNAVGTYAFSYQVIPAE